MRRDMNSLHITPQLSTAKQLQDWKWLQDESIYCWIEFYNTQSSFPDKLLMKLMERSELEKFKNLYHIQPVGVYDAPTADEIIAVLPVSLSGGFTLQLERDEEHGITVRYINTSNSTTLCRAYGNNLAEALALMWVLLKIEKHL